VPPPPLLPPPPSMSAAWLPDKLLLERVTAGLPGDAVEPEPLRLEEE